MLIAPASPIAMTLGHIGTVQVPSLTSTCAASRQT
jgi:hypothetical protein